MNNMMKCENMIPPTNCEMEKPKECLTAMLDEAHCVACDCLILASQIKEHLFGKEPPMNEPPKSPECFRDVLENQRIAIYSIAKTLAQIKEGLGL